MKGRATPGRAFAVGVVTVGTALAGCGVPSDEPARPTVSSTALQNDVARRLTAAGQRPVSVACREDLVGEVGAVARCDVVLSEANSFQPIVRVTGVHGDTVDYELTPALSQEQVEATVRRLVAERDGGPPDVVACESGLDGRVGAVVACDVLSGSDRVRRVLEVTGVTGLTMTFTLLAS